MSSARRVGAFLALSLIGLVGSAGAASAQAWGEAAPGQFKYSNSGQVNEVYRNQLGDAAATAAAASSSALAGSGAAGGQASSGAPGQSSGQVNNAVELNSNNTYNLVVSGSNYLNFGSNTSTVTAQQTSTGTKQGSSNSTSATQTGSSRYLNQ